MRNSQHGSDAALQQPPELPPPEPLPPEPLPLELPLTDASFDAATCPLLEHPTVAARAPPARIISRNRCSHPISTL